MNCALSAGPKEGAKESGWLNVNFELDPEGEKKQREKIEGLLEKLKKKSKSGDAS